MGVELVWEEYKNLRKHNHDFEVRYRVYSVEEGNTQKFFQGLRCDFKYADYTEDGIYMIHPEFLNTDGSVVLDQDHEVSSTGYARMWIIVPQMRELHKKRIKVGTKGYFVAGSKRLGEVEVVKIADLFNNPISD